MGIEIDAGDLRQKGAAYMPQHEESDLDHGFETVHIDPEPLDRFASVLDVADYDRLLHTAEIARARLRNRTVWNITSTSRGGGVAEMLASLLPLARGAGVDVRWLVLRADTDFFRLTKRIHNRLHGEPGDGGELGPTEFAAYDDISRERAAALLPRLTPNDLVILHDPQTAGLAASVRRAGPAVIWRCHIGVDFTNSLVESAWQFLAPYLKDATGYVFTRAKYVWEGFDPKKVAIIPPSIDVFSPKNQQLAPGQVEAILASARLADGRQGDARFVREDGSIGLVSRQADLLGGTPVPKDAPIVTQISRWDHLKDPLGVVKGFAEHVAPYADAHLVMAGPAVNAVSDDPEGSAVLAQVRALWSTFRTDLRNHIHLACLPMEDTEENAAIVNALQRRASVIVQKSLAEGFGLTVAEAMWKERPIVASHVGGIRDQLSNGVSGLLVEPTDLAAYGSAVRSLLSDPAFGSRLARAAHRRCREEYLSPRHLERYVAFFESLLS